MNFSQVVTFFALVAVGLTIWVAVGGVLIITQSTHPTTRSLVGALRPWTLPLAAAIATGATVGSLYLSEVVGLTPCKLCWFQRIAMYPLALILIIAAARSDRSVRLYTAVIASVGAAISAYHYLLQWFPSLEVTTCSATAPCSAALVWKFEFISIPYMALISFASVVLLLRIDTMAQRGEVDD